MSWAVFRHLLRQNRLTLPVIAAAMVFWGTLMPIIYSTFGVTLRDIIVQFPMLEQFMRFGGGNMFTLPGSIGLGFIHPIAISLLAVYAIAFPLSGVAGERQRGTLEVVLARPISRLRYMSTLFVAGALFVAIAMAATLAGTAIGAAAMGVLGELRVENLPLLWLHGTLLYLAILAIALAMSVSFDRLAPAAGITLAIVMTAYFLQVIGSLWPDAEWLQPYSLFYYLKPEQVLVEGIQPLDLAVLVLVALVAIAYALFVFPRRDLAAPA
jgi:ABC-2 type transport system permease protein